MQGSFRRGKKGPPGKAPSSKKYLDGPLHDEAYIQQEHNKSPIQLKPSILEAPRGHLNNFSQIVTGKVPEYATVQGTVPQSSCKQVSLCFQFRVSANETGFRTTVEIDIEPRIIGIGDHLEKKQSVSLAALSACYQLQELGVLDNPKKLIPKLPDAPTEATLSDGTVVVYDQARSFMDYYCRRYKFPSPDIDYVYTSQGRWEAVMTVDGRRIGLGSGSNKKSALTSCYLDVTKYLESCDPDLWKTYVEAAKAGKDLGLAPKVYFQASRPLEDAIGDLVDDIRHLALYKNRPMKDAIHKTDQSQSQLGTHRPWRRHANLEAKSKQLQNRRTAYLQDPKMEKMRQTRMALPVYAQAQEVLDQIAANDVTIVMAATGSGKTTQIPQMILDRYIEQGQGAKCNVICTQPRRLAALSVADRVSKERGESLGQAIGYHVRFESKTPEENGSVTFCTIGVFLKQLQSALSGEDQRQHASLDNVTHIVVDEVHERDVDTDLLLVVLKQLLAQKKAKNQSLKIVLMSATIDPALFQKYFPDDAGNPAKVISVPGRSFPVTKYFMDDFVPQLITPQLRWVMEQENVQRYIHAELGPAVAADLGVRSPTSASRTEDLELPYALIAATISHVLETSDDGHVLVFLPGWQEISATQKMLQSPMGPLKINFNSNKISLHILHSTIPLAEQQAIFEPPPAGVRRVILATNIAETSVTIPDVVYVIDTGKVKEQRYDPDRHMSSLVSAWVGTSNLNQRAGRAGRHRSGEYFGILSKAHSEALDAYQTVEMKRTDLSNVVMHVKALNFKGMTVEEVLAAAIEPPGPQRVSAAMVDLQMVGALDAEKNLTSLGRVLLQLPVDVQMGRLVLYGSFFRCLDSALSLAAILSAREPFMAPMHVKQQAQAKKESWSPDGFRSDALATLKAFNAWWAMQSRGEYVSANRFCSENFLSKPTLLLIAKTKAHLLQSLYRAGVIEVSAGGQFGNFGNGISRNLSVPSELNANSDSMPLLTALIAIACQPKFAIRSGEKTYRTAQDKLCIIHPSSVNHRKYVPNAEMGEKQLFAFAEKRRNETGGSSSTYLVTTTRIDPLTYILFGAYNVEVVERGLECDDWLPVVGDLRTLDDVQRLKRSIEACMLRVFEGITMSRLRNGQNMPVLPREEGHEDESEEEDQLTDYRLSSEEIKDLDILTRDVVGILNRYSDERLQAQSAQQSRAATPVNSPFGSAARLPSASASGYSTPNAYQSRPGTPSRWRKF
ncbi:P-loop containing nucleoside triphosphate hydrolase protein [Pholiota conissans]|uniref:P-loop containing nucleoside triphosphate hydrolase protein n=1 Tax=Pholiota conissans TaxID=109636 RepID=A0A9P5YL00_9AGAR|nr:P-loop containing nucleoside triphosphate hydrolase protein [Pholiota conissans]